MSIETHFSHVVNSIATHDQSYWPRSMIRLCVTVAEVLRHCEPLQPKYNTQSSFLATHSSNQHKQSYEKRSVILLLKCWNLVQKRKSVTPNFTRNTYCRSDLKKHQVSRSKASTRVSRNRMSCAHTHTFPLHAWKKPERPWRQNTTTRLDPCKQPAI